MPQRNTSNIERNSARLMPTLMIQGTTSDAGKSILTAGFCRVFTRKGHKVAPFKPQNMALNSAVTIDNGEIGRAQAVQAQACNQPPQIDFNPILLKPNSDIGAQVIVHGHPIGELDAADYHQYKSIAMDAVLTSYQRLSEQFQYLMVEGAGSPAEINLRDRDIANMGFAEAVDCPVIIVADIDKGGVFAHLVGTLELLSQSEQNRVIGFVINKFRGDIQLLQSGLDWLEEKTGKPVLGVLPYLHGLVLEAEDAITQSQQTTDAKVKISVLTLSRVSNHNDFDALAQHEDVNLTFVGPGQKVPACDLIIIPGSKSVRADVDFLRAQGWEQDIQRHLRYGGKLMGICGGLQILGEKIADPLGIEGSAGTSAGLALLPLATELQPEKELKRVSGTISIDGKATAQAQGYEIHVGKTHCRDKSIKRLAQISDQFEASYDDGFVSADGQIIATYIHGIFDHPEALRMLLNWVQPNSDIEHYDVNQQRELAIERLADAMEQHTLIGRIENVLQNWYRS